MKGLLIIVLLVSSLDSYAQPQIKSDWQAHWIGAKGPSISNSFFKFRRQYYLQAIPTKALASIAADSKYWLWINDSLVVFEGQLKRGPTPDDSYYDEVDILPYLRSGENSIAILLWYWGKDGFCHNSSGQAGLLFEAHLDQQTWVSDSSWFVAPHLAYQNSLPPFPNYRLPEHNIRYDARLDNENWISSKFYQSDWENAHHLGNAGAQPWNRLWKRPIPLWFDSGLMSYSSTPERRDNKVIAKLPRNLTVTPWFKIDAPEGLLIDIRTDNYVGGSEPNIRTEYITRKGIQEFESPAYFNGHEVIYSFPSGVKVLDLKYRETKYNTEYIGSFRSSDGFLDSLWTKAANTLNVNMRDAIQDPDRERAQWWGDVVIILEEIFYTCDARGKLAIRKAISNLVEWQKEDGVLYSPIPAGNWDRELPAQMLASVGNYGIWKYFEYTADTAMIRYVYPHLKKYLSLWSLNENGLVNHRAGGWDWHDWGNKIDVPLLDNAWYYMAVDAMFKMSVIIGQKEQAAYYLDQKTTVQNAFLKHFWKGNRFASDGYAHYADDRGNGLAVCAGFVTEEQWKAMRPVLDTVFHAGPYLEKYILEAYFKMGDAEAGISRLRSRYEGMVRSPVSTLWEGWEVGSGTYGGGTYNHGWSGGPLSLMSGYIAGIRPLDAGYTAYEIKPRLGGLHFIQCKVPTEKGVISLEITFGDVFNMKVQTIDGNGLIAVPRGKNNSTFRINGRKKHSGFRYSHSDENYVYYRCHSKGDWIITSD